MRRFQILHGAIFAAILFIFWHVFSFTGERRQSAASHEMWDREQRANFIRSSFMDGWNGYKENAYPHDMLKPLTNAGLDDR
jgi:hypothetical protein